VSSTSSTRRMIYYINWYRTQYPQLWFLVHSQFSKYRNPKYSHWVHLIWSNILGINLRNDNRLWIYSLQMSTISVRSASQLQSVFPLHNGWTQTQPARKPPKELANICQFFFATGALRPVGLLARESMGHVTQTHGSHTPFSTKRSDRKRCVMPRPCYMSSGNVVVCD
jgi:hypothetical protein